MKIVNNNLTAGISLVDKGWNDAMETAALYCEDLAHNLRAAGGDSDNWPWPAANIFTRTAGEFRQQKRGG